MIQMSRTSIFEFDMSILRNETDNYDRWYFLKRKDHCPKKKNIYIYIYIYAEDADRIQGWEERDISR